MGLSEERKAAARVRTEELRPQTERIAVAFAEAEAVWERRVIDTDRRAGGRYVGEGGGLGGGTLISGELATAEPQPMPPAHRGTALSGTAVSANVERILA
ncbi:hypothetical protein GCM10010398_61360 [Streptomyces fimbriatus]